jgi:hypothetical protein
MSYSPGQGVSSAMVGAAIRSALILRTDPPAPAPANAEQASIINMALLVQ